MVSIMVMAVMAAIANTEPTTVATVIMAHTVIMVTLEHIWRNEERSLATLARLLSSPYFYFSSDYLESAMTSATILEITPKMLAPVLRNVEKAELFTF